jgi:hypothetical protein
MVYDKPSGGGDQPTPEHSNFRPIPNLHQNPKPKPALYFKKII